MSISNRKDDLEYLKRLRERIEATHGYSQSQTSIEETSIFHAIKSFTNHHKIHSENSSAQQQQILFWAKWSFLGLAAYTLITFILAIIAHDANVMSAESGRAWVGPLDAHLSKPLVLNEPIEVTINYSNFGKEPAVDFSETTAIKTYSLEDWNSGSAYTSIAGFEDICVHFGRVAKGSRVVFPVANGSSYNLVDESGDLADKSKTPVTYSPEVKSGKQIITVLQCYIYRSDAKIRHTAACQFFMSGSTDPNHLAICASGGEAD